ncbi:MAG: hypothetical protein GY778_23430, partial [bacterium]|nr:hypothetical protein [bacterium]
MAYDPLQARRALEAEADQAATDAVTGRTARVTQRAQAGAEQKFDPIETAIQGGRWIRGKAAQGVGGVFDLTGKKTKTDGELETETTEVSKLDNQTYAHGAFMGAAGAFMADPQWNAIFAQVMPDDYKKAKEMTDLGQLMQHLENNPVLAAYGSARHMHEVKGGEKKAANPKSTGTLALEWDVFLPPPGSDMSDLTKGKIAHGNKGTTVGGAVAGKSSVPFGRDDVKAAATG